MTQKQHTHAQIVSVASKYSNELSLNPNDFAKWLSTANDGITNIVLMFGDLMGWRYIPTQ
jgi:hypothetical protein